MAECLQCPRCKAHHPRYVQYNKIYICNVCDFRWRDETEVLNSDHKVIIVNSDHTKLIIIFINK